MQECQSLYEVVTCIDSQQKKIVPNWDAVSSC